jgi:hypothetical protein
MYRLDRLGSPTCTLKVCVSCTVCSVSLTRRPDKHWLSRQRCLGHGIYLRSYPWFHSDLLAGSQIQPSRFSGLAVLCNSLMCTFFLFVISVQVKAILWVSPARILIAHGMSIILIRVSVSCVERFGPSMITLRLGRFGYCLRWKMWGQKRAARAWTLPASDTCLVFLAKARKELFS